MARLHDCHHEDAVAAVLVQRRIELGLTQKDICRKLKVANATLYYWERGEHYPGSFRLWSAWAAVLGLKFIVTVGAPMP